jgi:hypothetical protein
MMVRPFMLSTGPKPLPTSRQPPSFDTTPHRLPVSQRRPGRGQLENIPLVTLTNVPVMAPAFAKARNVAAPRPLLHWKFLEHLFHALR